MVTLMVGVHRAVGTWQRAIDAYIALTEFGKKKFIEGGLPAEKIFVKGNFVPPDPGIGNGKGAYAIFVGRLSPGEGRRDAFESLGGVDRASGATPLPLKIIGDGPLPTRSENLRPKTLCLSGLAENR